MLAWNAGTRGAREHRSDHARTQVRGCPAGQPTPPRSLNLARIPAQVALTLLLFSAPANAADCISIHDAGQHVGETKCVTGTVLRVNVGSRGVHFLNFCEDQIACPFTVVVFSNDLKDVGDVRHLEGRTITIRGAVKAYDGHPEIILSRISQIDGGAAMIPPLPRNYDVENRGHFSAGRLRPTKKPAKTKAKPNSSATYGNEADAESPPE